MKETELHGFNHAGEDMRHLFGFGDGELASIIPQNMPHGKSPAPMGKLPVLLQNSSAYLNVESNP